MSTVTYTPTQIGWWNLVGPRVYTAGALQLSDVESGGIQYTVPDAGNTLYRSLTLTLVTTAGGGVIEGVLTIGLVNDVDADPFTDDNYPIDNLLNIYTSDTMAISHPQTVTCTFDMEPDMVSGSVGGTVFEVPNQVLHHSGFQGNLALVLTWSSTQSVSFATSAALSTDQEPFLTGLTSGRDHQSRADFCPRCGTPLFREALVRDGYTKGLVCASCYDPPERKPGYWKPPKEVNP